MERPVNVSLVRFQGLLALGQVNIQRNRIGFAGTAGRIAVKHRSGAYAQVHHRCMLGFVMCCRDVGICAAGTPAIMPARSATSALGLGRQGRGGAVKLKTQQCSLYQQLPT